MPVPILFVLIGAHFHQVPRACVDTHTHTLPTRLFANNCPQFENKLSPAGGHLPGPPPLSAQLSQPVTIAQPIPRVPSGFKPKAEKVPQQHLPRWPFLGFSSENEASSLLPSSPEPSLGPPTGPLRPYSKSLRVRLHPGLRTSWGTVEEDSRETQTVCLYHRLWKQRPRQSHPHLDLWGTELEPASVTPVCVHALRSSESDYAPHTQRAHNPTHSAVPLAHSLKAWNLQTWHSG